MKIVIETLGEEGDAKQLLSLLDGAAKRSHRVMDGRGERLLAGLRISLFEAIEEVKGTGR